MIKIFDENGQIVTESKLRKSHKALTVSGEYNRTFLDYIAEYTGENGTLTMIDEIEE